MGFIKHFSIYEEFWDVYEAFSSVQGSWGSQVISQGKELRGVRVLPGALTASIRSPRTAAPGELHPLSVTLYGSHSRGGAEALGARSQFPLCLASVIMSEPPGP